MVEQKKRIMPVFYDITLDDVKLKTHLYHEALARHEKENEELWEKALKEVVEISGWESSQAKEGNALKEAVKIKGWELKRTGYVVILIKIQYCNYGMMHYFDDWINFLYCTVH